MKSIKGIKHCSTRKAFCISGKNYFHPIDSSKQITVNAGGKENAWKIFKVRGMEGFQVLTVEGRFPRADRSMWFVFLFPILSLELCFAQFMLQFILQQSLSM